MTSGVTQVASSLSFCPKPEANTPVIINNYNCTYNDILFHLENFFLIKINNFTYFFLLFKLFFSSVSFHVKYCGKLLTCQANKKKAKSFLQNPVVKKMQR